MDEHFPFLWLIIHVDVSFKSCLLSAPCLCFFPLLLSFTLFFLNCMEDSVLLPNPTTAVSYGFLFLCDFFLTCRVGFKAIGCAVGIQPRNSMRDSHVYYEKYSLLINSMILYPTFKVWQWKHVHSNYTLMLLICLIKNSKHQTWRDESQYLAYLCSCLWN